MKKSIKRIAIVLSVIVAVVCLALGIAALLISLNKNNVVPEFYVGVDGHLYGELNGETTDYGLVTGVDGQTGATGSNGLLVPMVRTARTALRRT